MQIKRYLPSFLIISLFLLSFFPSTSYAQTACAFYSVSQPLTDLGPNEYYRLTSINPPTYQATGHIGGLYPGGSNVRPPAHTAAGVDLANQIVPLDSTGAPAANGKIGLASMGMSNTSSEFGRFKSIADADPQVANALVIANSAAGGGTIERWIDPLHPQYNTYWNYFNTQIANVGLSLSQVQVVWVKVTNQGYKPNFPTDMQTLESQYELLAQELKSRLPNLKITYFSSRTRSFAYFAGPSEPTAFENGFAVRWLIEKQLNGDMALNFNPSLGPTPVSYLSWGPYLWIDGTNPRSDGRTWPLSNVGSDCIHPTEDGNQAVAEMLMDFFKSDPTATPWFINASAPTPTPTLTPTVGPSPTPTNTPTPSSTPTPTQTPSPTPTPTPTPTPLPPGSPISLWSFNTSILTDDINGCTGCINTDATWFYPSLTGGGYMFNGTSSSLNLGTFPYLNSKSSFTLSTWVRPGFNQTYGSSKYIFSDGNNIQLFYLSNINDWRASVRTTTGTYRADSSGATWTANTWHNLVITFDGASTKLYWDGTQAGSATSSGVVAADSGSTYLGRASAGGNNFLGDIDDLKVFDYALSASEISTLYQNP